MFVIVKVDVAFTTNYDESITSFTICLYVDLLLSYYCIK